MTPDQKLDKDPNNTNYSEYPWWVRVLTFFGLPTFLLLWFLGTLPFLPSPITARLEAHDRSGQAILRLICKGVWKDNQALQAECDRGN